MLDTGPGPVGAGPPRAADAQRAGQEGRRRAQRPGPGREHLLQGRLRLDRPGRPARPAALVGPLHPAAARHRRRQDRGPRAARARRRVLHAAGPHRRRPAHDRAAAGDRADLLGVRPGHRRHHRPAERAAALDPDRGRARRSGAGSRPSGCPPPRPAATPRGSSSARRSPASPPTRSSTGRRPSRRSSEQFIGSPEFSNLPRKFKTAISGSPLQDVEHEVNDISFIGVVHPEHGPGFDLWVGGGLSTNPMLAQRLGAWVPLAEVPSVVGRRRRRVPGLRLPAAAHPGPDQVPRGGLGGGGVPPGARGGVPRPGARRRARSPGAVRRA